MQPIDIDFIFSGTPKSADVFTRVDKGRYLANADIDTYVHVLDIINKSCADISGMVVRIKNFNYNDPKFLWASLNVDKILKVISPNNSGIEAVMSSELKINSCDSLGIIDEIKSRGIWVDDDMTVVLDIWKDKTIGKEELKQIRKVIHICVDDSVGSVGSNADVSSIIRNLNKIVNDIVREFLYSDVKKMCSIAYEHFDCELEVLVDALEPDENSYSIPTAAKEIIWKNLVSNRGLIKKLSFNIDTENENNVEVFKLVGYKDSDAKNKNYKFEGLTLSDIEIENAELKNCILHKSKFTKCKFDGCMSLGVKVKIKDCGKPSNEELDGYYIVLKKDKDKDKK